MKRLILSAIIIAGTVLSSAAQVRTAYFMEGTTFRSQFNPAFAPTQGYVNFPLVGLGGINVNLDGTLSVGDVIKRRPDGKLATILSGAFSQAEALSGISKGLNSLNANTNINLIGFGNYTKNHKNFWSVGINMHVEAAGDIPYDVFLLAKEFDQSKKYDFSKLNVFAQSYIDLGFNYSMPVTDKLYVGARAKFLVGLARANARIPDYTLDLNEDNWRFSAQVEGDIYMKGVEMPEGGTIDELNVNTKKTGPAGYGFAIDLGATYDVLENLQVSLAVNDIGFISWGSGSHLALDEEGLNFSGMDITIRKNPATGNVTTSTEGADLSLKDTDLYVTNVGKGRNTSALRATINAGVEYEMWNHWVGFGLLYHARMGLYKSSHNITASVNFHPRHWFTFTPSYTFNNNRGGALGLALNFSPRGFNFFLGTDLLLSKLERSCFIPYKQERMTFTMGVGFNIGRRGYRIAEYAKKWQKKE